MAFILLHFSSLGGIMAIFERHSLNLKNNAEKVFGKIKNFIPFGSTIEEKIFNHETEEKVMPLKPKRKSAKAQSAKAVAPAKHSKHSKKKKPHATAKKAKH